MRLPVCAPAVKAGGRSYAKTTALCGAMFCWSFFKKKKK
ncbi:rCG44748 [Rattus norvegicus]|uniref:RCG44748 n=1 Tax=Rattus norvegicus TaxID=10116 RepID=A6I5M5_RAT|nr:rCG44748 [Rattus norvegicus]